MFKNAAALRNLCPFHPDVRYVMTPQTAVPSFSPTSLLSTLHPGHKHTSWRHRTQETFKGGTVVRTVRCGAPINVDRLHPMEIHRRCVFGERIENWARLKFGLENGVKGRHIVCPDRELTERTKTGKPSTPRLEWGACNYKQRLNKPESGNCCVIFQILEGGVRG